jgi:shikimate kinase
VGPVRSGTIWLVGMMGAGKSAVGAALGRLLRRGTVDSDALVEAAANMTIREIFEREGEAGFRARERAAIEAQAGRPVVAALGGGAIAQPGMAELLAREGTVVYLRATPRTLAERVGEGAGRPLLRGLDAEGRHRRLAELLAERASAYERAALVLDTDHSSVEEVAAAIRARLCE